MSVAMLLGSLSNDTRLGIVAALSEGELSVNEVCERIGGSQPVVSQNLKVLRNAGVLTVEQRKTQRIYRLKDQRVVQLIQLAKDIKSGG